MHLDLAMPDLVCMTHEVAFWSVTESPREPTGDRASGSPPGYPAHFCLLRRASTTPWPHPGVSWGRYRCRCQPRQAGADVAEWEATRKLQAREG